MWASRHTERMSWTVFAEFWFSHTKPSCRKGTVLNVVQATEPNSIRWEDLNFRVAEKLKQTTITTLITIGAILVGSFAVTFAERASPGVGAAFTISGRIFWFVA